MKFLFILLAIHGYSVHHPTTTFTEQALCPALANFPDDGGGYNNPETHDMTIREWRWIHDLLEKSYPGHEFLIIHKSKITAIPSTWERIDSMMWRDHVIYKRKLLTSA